MPVRIAILGASGAVGSMLAAQLLRENLLEPDDRVLLVGHGKSSSEPRLLSVKMDLLDAFDDRRVYIDVVPDIMGFEADIVVVAAGATASAEVQNWRDLARANLPIFRQIADECVARLPDAIFIVISNPVELAVQVEHDRQEGSDQSHDRTDPVFGRREIGGRQQFPQAEPDERRTEGGKPDERPAIDETKTRRPILMRGPYEAGGPG
jgi:nucleoside-diphosphate-sugar epimerase